MASNKKPSIYSDRGSIGSTEELDEYGVWIKSEPQVLSAENSDLSEIPVEEDTLSIDDTAFDIGEPVMVENSKFEDIEFPDDDTNIDSINDSSAEMDMEDFNIDDSDTSEDKNIDSEISIEDDSFDDNLSITDEFASEDFGVPTVQSIENNIDSVQGDLNAAVMKDGDLSTQLLMKIANELSSIRSELQDLKREFSIVRSPAREEEDETIALTGDELDNIISDTEVPPDASASGFFADEEDDTIALTGDELDNIVNSADFTEESGVVETPQDEFNLEDESAGDLSVDTSEDLSSDSSDEISLDTSFEEAAEEPLADDSFENLSSASLSMDDDLLSNNLISDDMSAADLMADFGDDSATEIAEETPPAEDEELINIDIDDLNIDLNPDTILDESAVEAEASAVAEEDISIEEPATDETLEIKTDDDIDIDLGSDIDFGDDAFADIADDTASDDLSLDDISADDVTSEDVSLDDIPADDVTSEDISLDDIPSEDISLDAVSADDISLDDIPSEDVSADELSLDDVSFDEPLSADDLSDNLLADDVSLDDISFDEPLSADDLSDDISISEEPEASSEDEPIPMDDFLSMDTSIPEDETLSIDDLDTPLADDALNIEIDEENDAEELKKLRDEGAKPVTFAPDNSSYLEDEEINPDSFDLSDAVIDEPEMLSTDNISDNLIEPSLDDMDSLDNLTIDSAPEEVSSSADDLDIEIPADDGFVVDDFNDFETDTFDINEPIQAEPAPVVPPKAEPAPKAAPAPALKAAPAAPAPAAPALKAAPAAPAPAAPAAPAPAPALKAAPAAPAPAAPAPALKAETGPAPLTPPKFGRGGKTGFELPSELKTELRSILSYMDQLLESLPEEKIEEFAKSEYFDSYRKLFKDLGLV